MVINIMKEVNLVWQRGTVLVLIWFESSRKPLPRVMGVLSTEAESQPRECLGEEGKTIERFWCAKGP